MKVVFSDRAFAAVMAETAEKIRTETGGLFLGTVEQDTWYIIEAIDPGPESVFEVAYFEYDRKYTQHLINKVANLYEEKLSLIGLWHRHPGSMDVFSLTDNGTNAKYAKMRPGGAISALVNIDPRFRLTMYHVASPCRYTKIPYETGNELIPDKYMKLKTPRRYGQIMQDILRSGTGGGGLHPSVSLKSFMDRITPLLADRRISGKTERLSAEGDEWKDRLIDGAVSDISFMSDRIGIEMSVVQKNGLLALIQDSVDGMTRLFFVFCHVYSEKKDCLVFQYEGHNYLYEEGLFEKLYQALSESEERVPDKPEVTAEPDARNIINGVLRFMGLDRNGEE